MVTGCKVFVSYSHDSEEHRAVVRSLAEWLQGRGFEPVIDQMAANESDWQRWCRDQLTNAHAIVCVCTREYRQRFERRAFGDLGRGVEWEGKLIESSVYDRDESLIAKCVVVRLENGRRADIPLLLRHVPEFMWPAAGEALATRLERGAQAIRVAPPRGALFSLSVALAVVALLVTVLVRTGGRNTEAREIAADALAWDLVATIPYPGDDDNSLERDGKLCKEFATNRDSFLRCDPWKKRPAWPGIGEHVLQRLVAIDPNLEPDTAGRVKIFRADFGPTPLPTEDYRLVALGDQLVTARTDAIERVRKSGHAYLRGYHDLLRGAASSAMLPMRWTRLREVLDTNAPRPATVLASEAFRSFLSRASVARLTIGDLEVPAVSVIIAISTTMLVGAVVVLAFAVAGLVRSRRLVGLFRRQNLLPTGLALMLVGTLPLAIWVLRGTVAGLWWPLPGPEVGALATQSNTLLAAACVGAAAALIAALSPGRAQVRPAGPK